MEKVGFHKRDILVDRIEDVQDVQKDSKEQFYNALEELKTITQFDGGELEDNYNRLKTAFEDSEETAQTISDRIGKVESVAEHLFKEWRQELTQYTNQGLRRDSEYKLKATEKQYKKLLTAMRLAEKRIDPVLNTLRDHVLYLKHNLNARAIKSIKTELNSVKIDISRLVEAMEKSINESDQFISQLKQA